MFRALMLKEKDGRVAAAITDVAEDDLPPGAVTVDIRHSTLNYKDGMILKGLGRLVRHYPHIPGVDFAGTVAASTDPAWKPGDPVILTGWRVGETRWGGHAARARVEADWLVALPDGLTSAQAMTIGTAGFTAMLAVMALEDHGIAPESGEILVTGAAGGVGSVAISLLARLGYQVVAASGRPEAADYLRGLGATTVIDRASIATPSGKPLDAERWAGCVDAVGGSTLAALLPAMKYRGAIAACGLAGGQKLDTTVIPFLLRGVNLLGIDSVMCPRARRIAAWTRLARDLPLAQLEAMTVPARLEDLPALADDILAGKIRGRVLVDVTA